MSLSIDVDEINSEHCHHGSATHCFSLHTSELLGQTVGQRSIFLFKIDLHTLKAQIVGGVNVIDDNSLGHVPHQFGGVEFIVGSWRLDDLGLFLFGKVLVGIGWVDVLLVQIQDLVVGNDTGVGKVVDSSQSCLGHGL